ncbi:MAG: hypothetical protein ACAI44_24300 [Candidatus Sericytochromatia bacterium]
MSMSVNTPGGVNQPAFNSQGSTASQGYALPGGMEVGPIGINGSLLEQVGQLAKSMREAIEAADAGIRSCQVR